MPVSGERIVTQRGGFNASWQRHAACYAFAGRFLGPGLVLDVGCGTGHAQEQLAPRRVIGLDQDLAALAGHGRQSLAADMRALPFPPRSFRSVVCIHAIEHVADPDPLMAESVRVLEAGGAAVYVTPNRLTFGMPDEIIDPYHYVEYDPEELRTLCRQYFRSVEVFAVSGSPRYMELYDQERRELRALLRRDPLRLRRLVPRRIRRFLYDWKLTRARLREDGAASVLTIDDFELRSDDLDRGLDLMAVCAP